MKPLRLFKRGRAVLSRNICVTSRVCEEKKGDDYDPSKYVKDVKPDSILVKEYREKIDRRDPIQRTKNMLLNDMKFLGNKIKAFAGFDSGIPHDTNPQFFPTHADVVVIGGGAIGSSVAYWLKQRAPHAMSIVVVEKDATYCEASTCLSVGGVRQQFSIPENVQMSLFGAEFLRTMHKKLAIDGKPAPDPQFQPYGYLFLASESGAATLQENSEMQCKLGAKNILLSPEKLKERFPWINTDGVELACLGLENEGWFDPWSLLNALKQKSINLGVEYIQADVIGYDFRDQPHITVPSADGKYEQIDKVVVKLPNGELQSIKFGYCILAAGANSGRLAELARIGTGEGLLSVPLPIEPRKRYVYCYHCPGGPGLDTPLVIDPSGTYFRREGLGGMYIAGRSPTPEEEPPTDNLDVDYSFFDEKIWPVIAKRVPAFENLKMKNAWAGFYEYNTMDENGVIGLHPYYHNLIIASGFSGHGIQHAPAVGRAIMELLLDGEFKTIDLSRFGFDRMCLGEPLIEKNIV